MASSLQLNHLQIHPGFYRSSKSKSLISRNEIDYLKKIYNTRNKANDLRIRNENFLNSRKKEENLYDCLMSNLAYSTARLIKIHSPRVAFTFRLFQFIIISYIIG